METQYLPVSNLSQASNDHAGHETKQSDTSEPDAKIILGEGDIATDEKINADTETQYLTASKSILTNSEQTEHAENHSESINNTSPSDFLAIHEKGDNKIKKETPVTIEMHYLPISESILINNHQAEQETNYSESTSDTSIPVAAAILAEDVGNSQTPRTIDYDIEELKSIGKQHTQRLREINIETTQQLLNHTNTPAAIAELGRRLNEEESLIQTWISMADLIRVPGIRGQFAELITRSGVLSVTQLAAQNAPELTMKISDSYQLAVKNAELSTKGNRYCAKPSIDMVNVWIDAAKELNDDI